MNYLFYCVVIFNACLLAAVFFAVQLGKRIERRRLFELVQKCMNQVDEARRLYERARHELHKEVAS